MTRKRAIPRVKTWRVVAKTGERFLARGCDKLLVRLNMRAEGFYVPIQSITVLRDPPKWTALRTVQRETA